jgi:hypothetical protein
LPVKPIAAECVVLQRHESGFQKNS